MEPPDWLRPFRLGIARAAHFPPARRLSRLRPAPAAAIRSRGTAATGKSELRTTFLAFHFPQVVRDYRRLPVILISLFVIMLLVSVNAIARAEACACADEPAFPPANQRATDRANGRSDGDVFGFARTIMAMVTPLRVGGRRHRGYQKHDREQYRPDLFQSGVSFVD